MISEGSGDGTDEGGAAIDARGRDMPGLIVTPNVSWIDRGIRFGAGSVQLCAAMCGPRFALGYLGVPLLLTALIGFCPMYRLLGLSTRADSSHGVQPPDRTGRQEP